MMNKAMLSLLTESELLLVRETEPATLALLDEDATGDLLVRVRRARNKYSTNYRRQSAKRVVAKGSRGAARGSSNKTAMKAEIFEEALARVSRRLATLARQSATDLKAERLAAARGAAPVGSAASPRRTATTSVRKAPVKPTTKSQRTPARKKQVASSGAAGARRQAKRDAR